MLKQKRLDKAYKMDKDEHVIIRERRRGRRTKKSLKFKILPENGSYFIIGETKDLSCIGVSCKMNIHLPAMTRLSINLTLPDGNESFEGIVVRSDKVGEDEYDMAIYFSEIDLTIRKKIDDFVNGEQKLQDFKIDD